MRHNRRNKRFNREIGERRAMLENMVSSLLTHQEITTTLQKAKEAKRLADKVITLGKKDTLPARRQVFSYLQDHSLTSKLFKEVAPRFKTRNGGYTRILHLSRRKGDGAQLALLELTEKEIKIKETKKKTKDTKQVKGHVHGEHDGHTHGDDKVSMAEPEAPKSAAPTSKYSGQPAKGGSASGGKPKGGFFKNLGKFFRNKGGG